MPSLESEFLANVGNWTISQIKQIIKSDSRSLEQSLYDAVSNFFPIPQLVKFSDMKISNLNDDGNVIAEQSEPIHRFTIQVGTTAALQKRLDEMGGTDKSVEPEKAANDEFARAMITHYTSLFSNSEAGYIRQTLEYNEKQLLHIVIYNLTYQRDRKRKKGCYRVHNIIGAATFYIGHEIGSILLYIGIRQRPITINNEIEKNEDSTEKNIRPAHGNYLGSFMLALIQKITNTSTKKWRLVCQAFDNEEKGASMFYFKSLFRPVNEIDTDVPIFREDLGDLIHSHPKLIWVESSLPTFIYHPYVYSVAGGNGLKSLHLAIDMGRRNILELDEKKESSQVDYQERLDLEYASAEKTLLADPIIEVTKHVDEIKDELKKLKIISPEKFNDILTNHNFEGKANWIVSNLLSLGGKKKDCGYMMLHEILNGHSLRFMNVRIFLYFILTIISRFDEKHHFVDIEKSRETNTESNSPFHFHHDVFEALARLELLDGKKAMESAGLLLKDDDPINSASNADLRFSLLKIAYAQLRRDYSAGRLEFRIMAAIFNVDYKLLRANRRPPSQENKNLLMIQIKHFNEYQKYGCFREIKVFAWPRICTIYRDSKSKCYLVNRNISRDAIKLMAEESSTDQEDSLIKWLNIATLKKINGHDRQSSMFKPEDFQIEFIKAENRLVLAKILDPLSHWKYVLQDLTTEASMSLLPNKWLKGSAIDVFIDSAKTKSKSTFFYTLGMVHSFAYNEKFRSHHLEYDKLTQRKKKYKNIFFVCNIENVHWYSCQIENPGEKVDKLKVYVADSLAESKLTAWDYKPLGYLIIANFLNWKNEGKVFPSYTEIESNKVWWEKYKDCLEFEYVKHRTTQDNSSDCGIHVAMRLYRAVITDEIDTEAFGEEIYPPYLFRLFIMNKILEKHRNKVKPVFFLDNILKRLEIEEVERNEKGDDLLDKKKEEEIGQSARLAVELVGPNEARTSEQIPYESDDHEDDDSTVQYSYDEDSIDLESEPNPVVVNEIPEEVDTGNEPGLTDSLFESYTQEDLPATESSLPEEGSILETQEQEGFKERKVKRKNSSSRSAGRKRKKTSSKASRRKQSLAARIRNQKMSEDDSETETEEEDNQEMTIFDLNEEYDKEYSIPKVDDIEAVPEDLVNEMIQDHKNKLRGPPKKRDWAIHAFNESQLSQKAAREAVEAEMQLEMRKNRNEFLKIDRKLQALVRELNAEARESRNPNYKWSSRKDRLYRSLRAQWIDLKRDGNLLKWEYERIPLFHPRDSIKAIQVRKVKSKKKNEKRSIRYYAYIVEEDGTEHCKEVARQFLEDNLSAKYIQALDQHTSEKGWIAFDKNDEMVIHKQKNQIASSDNLKPIYEYKEQEKGDTILWLKLSVKFDNVPDENDKEKMKLTIEDHFWSVRTTGSNKDFIDIDSETLIAIIRPRILLEYRQKAFLDSQRDFEMRNSGQKPDLRVIVRNDRGYKEEQIGVMEYFQPHYFNVRTMQYQMPLTKLQISRIKYDQNRKCFVGLEREPDKEHPNIVVLRNDWMKKNFSAAQIAFFKEESMKGSSKFLQVPIGDIIEVIPSMDISKNPPIYHRNNESAICAFASLANALYFLGLHKESEVMMEKADLFMKEGKDLHRILGVLTTMILGDPQFKKLRKSFALKKIKKRFDIFSANLPTNSIQLVILHQSDNHTSHAVAVINEWIFDCNTTNALPFTEEGLNCCCGVDASFVYVFSGFQLIAQKP